MDWSLLGVAAGGVRTSSRVSLVPADFGVPILWAFSVMRRDEMDEVSSGPGNLVVTDRPTTVTNAEPSRVQARISG